uniref:HTH_Tnp_Tc3_1 domain-containing protein n=1 Tax=Heterorhabditis bacteriophora TaxID=37862 RepID=A0A1I7WVM6_HETBA
MGCASTLSLDERGQIKVLSTASYMVKQIANVVKRSRKAIMNFLRHQEEYGKFYGQRRVARSASLEPVRLVTLVLQKLRCGECWRSIPILFDHG